MLKKFDENKNLVCTVFDIYEDGEMIADDSIIYEVDKNMSWDDICEAVNNELKKCYPHYEIDIWGIDPMRF